MTTRPSAPNDRSMAEVLRRHAADHPASLAFQFLESDGAEGPRLTNAELDRQAAAIAAELLRLSGPGERALLLYAPGLEFIPAFFGCLYAGVVAVPAYPPRPDRPWQSADGLSRIASDCRPSVVLTGGEAAGDVERMCRGIAPLSDARWIDTSTTGDSGRRGWSREAEAATAISHLQYTSGSTGDPKGVAISHGNLMHNEYMIALCSGHFETAAAGICGVGWLPFQHDLGLVAGMLQAVYVGGPLIVMSPLTMLQRPFVWLEAISRYRGYTSGGPNFAYELCVRRTTEEQRASLDLSCWGVAGIGAEPVRPAAMDAFAETFSVSRFRCEAFYPSYGLAEGTLMVAGGDKDGAPVVRSFSAAALERNKAVAGGNGESSRTLVGCGRSWLDQKILIVDPETRAPVGSDLIGEVWVAGPSVANGYWNRPEETEATFRARLTSGEGPFLRTGDLGFVSDGELFITGRLKDLLIVRGQNHYPHDVEETVRAVDPSFRPDSGAAFQTEQNSAERLVVLQEIDRAGRPLDPGALTRRIRTVVGERHGIEIDEIVFVRNGTLPKTTSGKVRRHACKAAYQAGRLSLWQPKPTA